MPPLLSFSASQVISLALKKPPVQSGLQLPDIQKKIFAYTKTLPNPNGLVQLQDKIVVRFALTIYPYSLWDFYEIFYSKYGSCFFWPFRGIPAYS